MLMLTTICFTICFLVLYHLFQKYYLLKSFSTQPHVTKYVQPVEFNDTLKNELLNDLEQCVDKDV
jgi:hypothetical protein